MIRLIDPHNPKPPEKDLRTFANRLAFNSECERGLFYQTHGAGCWPCPGCAGRGKRKCHLCGEDFIWEACQECKGTGKKPFSYWDRLHRCHQKLARRYQAETRRLRNRLKAIKARIPTRDNGISVNARRDQTTAHAPATSYLALSERR
jgi:hypothetical protein